MSNTEPRETLTPWGKMSLAYFVAQGDVPPTPSYARPAWACTGCLACRESCDHRNEVTPTLLDARAGLVDLGIAPEAATRTIQRFERHDHATRQAVRELGTVPAAQRDSKTALLIGCAYARGAPREARDAIRAATGLVGGAVALVEACCGLPLLHAGDKAAFGRQALALATETADKKLLLVADAGCAHALRAHYPSAHATISPAIELLVERAARDLGRLSRGKNSFSEPVRYHDPCLLGRGLGVYEAPRAILTRALGRAPDEFDARRAGARCSGAGGLLPRTMPETSRAIADARVREHEQSGGGHLVTACASSLYAFRRSARGGVSDLVTWIARSVPSWHP